MARLDNSSKEGGMGRQGRCNHRARSLLYGVTEARREHGDWSGVHQMGAGGGGVTTGQREHGMGRQGMFTTVRLKHGKGTEVVETGAR